jgi:cobalt-zinc-cadmium efflux system protein
MLHPVIFGVEVVAGLKAQSLSLIMDAVHNLADEAALLFLFLAFVLPLTLATALQRWANFLNSVGLVVVSGLVVWHAVERLLYPVPVLGLASIVVGLLAAAANWGVARLLLKPSRQNSALRLAYRHNMGDVLVALAPVAAGLLIVLTGHSFFDPLVALGIASWMIWSTALEVIQAREELIYPEQLVCGHDGDERTAAA